REHPAEQRHSVLAGACAGNEALREKVASLLKAHERAPDFLVSPAWSPAFQADAGPALQPGMQLGPYEIVSSLGKGGMGEVYRARDTKLRRDVAIKVLPDEFARDPERLARFQREAELLAALNHPNIAAIYGFEGS